MTTATGPPDGANGNTTALPDGDAGDEMTGVRKSLTAAGSAGYAGSSASPNAIRSGRPGSGLSLSVLGNIARSIFGRLGTHSVDPVLFLGDVVIHAVTFT